MQQFLQRKRCAFTNLQTSKRSKAISADGVKGQLLQFVTKQNDALKDKPYPVLEVQRFLESLKMMAIS
jgi:hypothetical protein